MKEPKPKTETETVGSPAASPSPQVGEGRGEGAAPSQPIPTQSSSLSPQSSKERQDALDEAAKLCGDLRNSIEAIGAFAITGHTDVVRQHYAIYADRAKNLHTILSGVVENLPTL